MKVPRLILALVALSLGLAAMASLLASPAAAAAPPKPDYVDPC